MKAFAGGQAAAYKMFETINRESEIDAYSATGRKLDDIQGDIEFRDVYYSYPTRPDEQIFRGFSLAIQSGTTVALVGQSGSGKSTVISLIERFYDPQLGQVLIDGLDLKEFQLRWVMKDELDGKMSSCSSRLQASHYIYTRIKITRDMYLSYKLQQNIGFYL
jgi:ATP-binding cassette, subfamily B (MDR/TAP), member 1